MLLTIHAPDALQKESLCKHARFGCKGKKGHKTERSQHCDYHKDKLGALSIAEAQSNWVLENSSNDLETGKFNKKMFISTKFDISNLNQYYFIISN